VNKNKTIRLWNGTTVVGLLSVSPCGSTWSGATGGAENSTPVDIEFDPWKGLLVEHTGSRGVIDIHYEPEADDE
jgi:hypothetical protein